MMKVSIPSSVKSIGEYNFKGGKSMIWQIIDITILESKIVQFFFVCLINILRRNY